MASGIKTTNFVMINQYHGLLESKVYFCKKFKMFPLPWKYNKERFLHQNHEFHLGKSLSCASEESQVDFCKKFKLVHFSRKYNLGYFMASTSATCLLPMKGAGQKMKKLLRFLQGHLIKKIRKISPVDMKMAQ